MKYLKLGKGNPAILQSGMSCESGKRRKASERPAAMRIYFWGARIFANIGAGATAPQGRLLERVFVGFIPWEVESCCWGMYSCMSASRPLISSESLFMLASSSRLKSGVIVLHSSSWLMRLPMLDGPGLFSANTNIIFALLHTHTLSAHVKR